MRKPKIIVYDCETSPILAYTWTLYPESISHESIVRDWFIISASWKVVGEKKVHSVSINKPYDDYNVVKTLRDELSTADLIVGHNNVSFDDRKLLTRMIYHGLDPLPDIPVVDTKKAAKKAGFTSNRLDHLCKFLTGKGKIHVDYNLWLKVMDGDKKALKEMVEYNKIDVVRDEELYLKLRPYMKNHPHLGVMAGNGKYHSCPNCGSIKLKRNGIRPTKSGVVRQEVKCTECGSFHRVAIEK